MSCRSCRPASAVPTIWACCPRHGGPPRRAPAARRKACPERSRRERSRRLAHVCPHNELPTSSLQLRFRESDGPAVPPSRHAGRCCCIPGSRTNHRELHRSPGTGLPTSRPALSAVEGTARSRKSFIMHTYEKRACKSFGMHCYKIVGLKVPLNDTLTKKGGWGGRVSRKSGQYLSAAASGKPRVTGAAGATSANGWRNVDRAQR